jgi:DNA-binding beta-propeller fold protein YncE
MTDLMNRRSFLGNVIAGLAASGLLAQVRGWAQATTNANGLNLPIGFQSYVFREEISQKPQETMGRLASYGYRTVEWCSPKGYQGPFTPLVKYSGKELKKITNDSGLETCSCHFTWNEIMNDNSLAERIEFASGLSFPAGLAFNSTGDLFVSNQAGDNITKITTNGTKSTFISGLDTPNGIAFDSTGDLFVANTAAYDIVKITPGGVESVFAVLTESSSLRIAVARC